MKRHALAVVGLFFAAILAFGPTAAQPGSAIIGHPYGDLVDHYWGTWWFGEELFSGRFPNTTNLSHFPDALKFWHIDALGALLALPFRPLGMALSWNLLVFGQLFAATLVGYWAGLDLTGSRSAGFVSGIIAGLSPYALGLVHSGLSECLWMAPVVAYVPMLLRAMGLDPRGRPPLPKNEWIAAGLLAAAGGASLYYAIFGALFALAAIPGTGWRIRLGPGAKIVAAAAVMTVPLAWPTLVSLGAGGAVNTANAPGWAGRLPATDILTFFAPGAYYFPDTPAANNPGILHVNYLGFVAIALASVAARGAFLRVGLLYFAFALGPRLAFGKQILYLGGTSVLLPLGFLSFPGSPFAMIHQPYRLVSFFVPWLALAGALAVLRIPARFRPLVGIAVLAETLLISPAAWPVESRTVPTGQIYEGLKGPVLDWPPQGSQLNRDYLLAATVHGQAVPYGVNVFLPVKLREDVLVDSLLRALNDLDGHARNRDVPFQGGVLRKPKGSKTRLHTLGIRHVVVHKSALDDREWGRTSALLEGSFGVPERDDPEVAVWATR